MNIHSVSLKGLREHNEDKHIIILNIDNNNPNLAPVNLYGIFDGHGGKTVSKFLYDNLSKFFMDPKVIYPLSKRYVNDVCDEIQKNLKAKEYARHIGSTALVVIQFKYHNENYVNVINVGDCRCIICRDNFAMPLTKDHKPNWPEERGRIEKLGGNIIFDNYDWRIKDLSVSRAFGDIDATPYVTHRPDLFRYKLDRNDKFIILSCDGLFEKMTTEDSVNFVLLNSYDATTKKRTNQKINMAKKLAEYGIEKGSGDNISTIIIFLSS